MGEPKTVVIDTYSVNKAIDDLNKEIFSIESQMREAQEKKKADLMVILRDSHTELFKAREFLEDLEKNPNFRKDEKSVIAFTLLNALFPANPQIIELREKLKIEHAKLSAESNSILDDQIMKFISTYTTEDASKDSPILTRDQRMILRDIAADNKLSNITKIQALITALMFFVKENKSALGNEEKNLLASLKQECAPVFAQRQTKPQAEDIIKREEKNFKLVATAFLLEAENFTARLNKIHEEAEKRNNAALKQLTNIQPVIDLISNSVVDDNNVSVFKNRASLLGRQYSDLRAPDEINQLKSKLETKIRQIKADQELKKPDDIRKATLHIIQATNQINDLLSKFEIEASNTNSEIQKNVGNCFAAIPKALENFDKEINKLDNQIVKIEGKKASITETEKRTKENTKLTQERLAADCKDAENNLISAFGKLKAHAIMITAYTAKSSQKLNKNVAGLVHKTFWERLLFFVPAMQRQYEQRQKNAQEAARMIHVNHTVNPSLSLDINVANSEDREKTLKELAPLENEVTKVATLCADLRALNKNAAELKNLADKKTQLTTERQKLVENKAKAIEAYKAINLSNTNVASVSPVTTAENRVVSSFH